MLHLSLTHQLKQFRLSVILESQEDFVVLFGPSGAGKSLTLRAIAGLIRPDEGRVCVDGQVLFDSRLGVNLPPQQRRVGYVTQQYHLFPHLNIRDNVGYGLRGVTAYVRRERVEELLALVRLSGYADYFPHELSGGQRQRVALARALAIEPSILLLDEPFSALDQTTRTHLRLELRHLQQQLRIPTLLVTHDLTEANTLADEIAVYHQGQILQIDRPPQLMREPNSVQVAQLIGFENILSGKIEEVQRGTVTLNINGVSLVAKHAPYHVGAQVRCCIRGQQIILQSRHPTRHVQRNQFSARVMSVMSDGLTYSTALILTEGRLCPDQPYDLILVISLSQYDTLVPQPNEIWTIRIPPNALHLVGG